RKDGPLMMLQRSLRDIGVVIVTPGALASPRQRPGELPAGTNLAGVECACREAFLVYARLELFGVDEVAPAALQREFVGRIPRDADRCGIERPRFDVPAMLVRLTAVEPADLELHAIDDDTAGDHPEADMRRVQPMV